MKKLIMAAALTFALTMLLCACGGTALASEVQVILPEDNGLAGIYKWIEMGDYGLETYLILWDDGIGSIDIVGTGTVRGVFYNDETMQVADEGTVPQKYTYADDKLIWTYTDEQGEHSSTFVRLTAEERAAYEALGVGSVVETEDEDNKGNAPQESATAPDETTAAAENTTDEIEEVQVILPEDNGLAGIYKWIEMGDYGLETYLILWDDGIGSIDIVGTGTVRGVFYNDETMQVADEGTVPQKYTYADDKLTWIYTDEQGEHSSTFVRLTAEERAAYEALGVGSVVVTEDGE